MDARPRGGRGLAGLLAVCVLVVALLIGARLVSERTPRVEGTVANHSGAILDDGVPWRGAPETAAWREELSVNSAPAEVAATLPATTGLTGRLQVNGFAARRGRVRIQSNDGGFEQELVIDPYGRFYAEGVPTGKFWLGFEAEGLFERQLLLPDRCAFEARAGEIAVVDLDWWTRHVNVYIGGEEGELRAASVELSGPGYSRTIAVDESGIARLDLVGQGIFTFRARTADGREDDAELDLAADDQLDTVALVPHMKKG
jgi:hypothetical protein